MKVDLLIPTYRLQDPQALIAIRTMEWYTRSKGYDLHVPPVHSGGVIHWVRNEALAAIRKDTDYVLFCDDDMAPPRDAAVRLLRHNLPVCSALTTTRSFPVRLTLKKYNPETGLFYQAEDVVPDVVAAGQYGAGAGFLLVAKYVIDDLLERWLSADDWVEDNQLMLSRLHVRAELRDREKARIAACRRERLAAGDVHPHYFEFFTAPDQHDFGEDMSFCRRILLAGYDIGIDTGVHVSHMGTFPFGPSFVGIQRPEEVRQTPLEEVYA